MARNLHDSLAKNILHDLFSLRGAAQTEAEVPPGNARRIDLWFVPENGKLGADIPEFVGILAQLIAEPAAIEIWSAALDVDDFFMGLLKRELWRAVLEHRDKRPWVRPMLWHLCAGKPETALQQFAYECTRYPGLYMPSATGLRVPILVLGELPNTRETLLLRLLGKGRVRRDALRELWALPHHAWEKKLAHPWLVRVGWDVPVDELQAPEDKEIVMDIQAWYKTFIETHDREVEERVARKYEEQMANHLVRQFERRVGRKLSADERETLGAGIKTYGSEYLTDLVLDLSGPDLAAWLEKNGVAQND